jgi:hypothetical protein
MNKIDAGVQAGFRSAAASGYTSQNSINIEGGIIFQLSEQLRLGFHVFDPVALKIKYNDLPVTSFSAGIGYDGSGDFHFEILLQKEERLPVNVCAAIHYAVGETIFFRMGISCTTPIIFAGAGCMLQNIRVDAIATYHPYLGITPAIAFVFKKSR